MFESPQAIRDRIASRVQSSVETLQLPVPPNQASAFAAQFTAAAVEVRPWSQNQLVTIRERTGKLTSLGLSGRGKEPPSVVYYKPIEAAKLVASGLVGVIGAEKGIIIGLSVILGILAIKDVRTVASAAESLLFWIVYSLDDHRTSREDAKARFRAEAGCLPEIEHEDFEPALHALTRLGCMRLSGDSLEISDKVILHLK